MSWPRQGEPGEAHHEADPEGDTDEADHEEVERSPLMDGVDMFAPTSLKYLELDNPLRRRCIRLMLSPLVTFCYINNTDYSNILLYIIYYSNIMLYHLLNRRLPQLV